MLSEGKRLRSHLHPKLQPCRLQRPAPVPVIVIKWTVLIQSLLAADDVSGHCLEDILQPIGARVPTYPHHFESLYVSALAV